MGFIGPVNRLGDTYVRPHDIEIQLSPNGTTSEATVDHLVHLGFEVRVELTLKDGRNIWAQITREDARHLDLERGKPVYIKIDRSRVFGEIIEEPLPNS
jgi:sulfate transport system ATP-binding protein